MTHANRKHARPSVGQTFGRWTVTGVDEDERNRQGQHLARVVCVCGVEKLVMSHSLRTGTSRGCASCAARERLARSV
jgi:hypothetical protein